MDPALRRDIRDLIKMAHDAGYGYISDGEFMPGYWEEQSKLIQDFAVKTQDDPDARLYGISELTELAKKNLNEFDRVPNSISRLSSPKLKKRFSSNVHQTAYLLHASHTLADRGDTKTKTNILTLLNQAFSNLEELGNSYQEDFKKPPIRNFFKPLENA